MSRPATSWAASRARSVSTASRSLVTPPHAKNFNSSALVSHSNIRLTSRTKLSNTKYWFYTENPPSKPSLTLFCKEPDC